MPEALAPDRLAKMSKAELVGIVRSITDSTTIADRIRVCIVGIGDDLDDFAAARASLALRLAAELDYPPDPEYRSTAQVASELGNILDQLQATSERADDFDDEYRALQAELSAPLVNPED